MDEMFRTDTSKFHGRSTVRVQNELDKYWLLRELEQDRTRLELEIEAEHQMDDEDDDESD
jgi:hypothetical protein